MRLAPGNAAQRVVAIDLVQIVVARLAADELHVDQSRQRPGGVDADLVRLQQIVDRHRRHRRAVDGQRLHHLLRQPDRAG